MTASYQDLQRKFAALAEGHDKVAAKLSFARLATFIVSAVFFIAGVAQDKVLWLGVGAAALVVFCALVVVHLGVLAKRDAAQVRSDVHKRHVQRMDGTWRSWPWTEGPTFPVDHPYADDLDLCGQGSLMQRIDVTHTKMGEATIARLLGEPARLEQIAARQSAIRTLAADVDFRQELEAAALRLHKDKIDTGPFLAFVSKPTSFQALGLTCASYVLPPVTLALWMLGKVQVVPRWVFLITLLVQFGIVLFKGKDVAAAYDLISTTRGWVDSFHDMLLCIERAEWSDSLLQSMKKQMLIDSRPPSIHMKRLARWVGLLDFRTQGIVHIVVNPLVLWDVHCLRRIERWNVEIGSKALRWFEVLAEFEALSSLATFASVEPAATYPTVTGDDGPFEAEGLVHPLLPGAERVARVANDLRLPGPSSALIVTGSNMAGKSTLLRAVGVNIALALSGAPVCASRMTLPRVRLRASMRTTDSLQRGASYFQAELQKLKIVVNEAESTPPVFFLLDELLRGTNAHARYLGAKAVVEHLLARRALGLVATHDTQLAELETAWPTRVANAHSTDVVVDGEMVFDYRLRPGMVRSSNALRLLRMAGIDVVDDAQLESSGE